MRAAHDAPETDQLAAPLQRLWEDVVAAAGTAARQFPMDDLDSAASRDNLLAYLSLRQHDIERLQLGLADHGLSSLGRLESHTLQALREVLFRLGAEGTVPALNAPARLEALRILARRTAQLLGRPRAGRSTRIMVTLDSQSAGDGALVEGLLLAGMDIARINCAHETTQEWERTIASVRAAEARLDARGAGVGRRCRIAMDLSGPRVRTGPIVSTCEPVKLAARRDRHGRRVGESVAYLVPDGPSTGPAIDGRFAIGVSGLRSGDLREGDALTLTDTRGDAVELKVRRIDADGTVEVLASRSAYLDASVVLLLPDGGRIPVASPQDEPARIRLGRGDRLRLYRDPSRLGHPSVGEDPAGVPCEPSEALDFVNPGDRAFIDGGRIAGVVSQASPDWVELSITAPEKGVRLREEQGLNFPDSRLDLQALTAEDREALRFVVEHATAVGLSFVHGPADLADLHAELTRLGRPELGIIAKIETRTAVNNLSRILLAGLALPRFGVMIARGDLAVEIGFAELAFIQNDILSLCEAAHVPVVLATQVLESMARIGIPARAEITDAVVGQRADCVMLNKGPHVLAATAMLAELLTAEARRHLKKRDLFREFMPQAGVLNLTADPGLDIAPA